jgi:hypothetical protein
MTKVTILPAANGDGAQLFHAIAGTKYSDGATADAARDALASQFSEQEKSPLVIVLSRQGDQFFNDVQKIRLKNLFARWQAAKDSGASLSESEQAELESLVDAEVVAAGKRAEKLADELGA